MDNFKDSFDEDTKDITSTGFFKFKEGDNKLRILSAPLIKVSRWGHGVCYKDAPYCSAEALEEAALSRGILPALSFSLQERAFPPTQPALWGRGLMALSGALIGLLLGAARVAIRRG